MIVLFVLDPFLRTGELMANDTFRALTLPVPPAILQAYISPLILFKNYLMLQKFVFRKCQDNRDTRIITMMFSNVLKVFAQK